ncbi:AI-2E family transporter [Jeotgalibacillus sp. ET6]|uniref:AI-2E family transporter n=1 Tax=Jeotgalibacillus sp. ET6 TaxID=3037260 RepID=UPI002418444E|nr:AI-2E family transporter [Jeotgalibacillus sp. ET6]MDG5470901.1 AI-2E family transporter [Jeotgalibacillus sp. ET6]
MDSLIKKWLPRLILILFLLLCGWIFSYLWKYIQPVFAGIWLAVVPLLLSILFAYLLLPLVHFLMRAKCSNRLAVSIVFVVLTAVAGALFQWWIPAFAREWNHFLTHLPDLLDKVSDWNHAIADWLSSMPQPVSIRIQDFIHSIQMAIEQRAEELLAGINHSLKWIIALSLVPFMTFYLVKDRIVIRDYIMNHIPQDRKKQVVSLAADLDQKLGSYIRGQLWLSAAVAVFSFAVLYAIKLPYALPLGLLLGIFNVIPYLGPIIGALPALLVASTISGSMVIWVIAAAFGIQMVESHLLAPWIMGKTIHIHPVMIMLLLLIGGELGGMAGLIAVVPVYMIIGMIIHSFKQREKEVPIDK